MHSFGDICSVCIISILVYVKHISRNNNIESQYNIKYIRRLLPMMVSISKHEKRLNTIHMIISVKRHMTYYRINIL